MRLLTKIIGKPPGEMSAEELHTFVVQNRVRIRREIKEYRKLKAAIRAESPKMARGRPAKAKAIKETLKKKEAFIMDLAKETGASMDDILAEIRAIKEKRDGRDS